VIDANAEDLLRYLRRRVNQPEDAADILGRVLLALWEHSAKIPAIDSDARMWCFGVARNMLREHRRHAARHLDLADELRDYLRSTSSHDNAADTAAVSSMEASDVRSAVRSLEVKSRELVTLVHWDGFSIAAAARLLGMNESTARTRYQRALQRLERVLSERLVGVDVDAPVPRPDLTAGI
jgi:RNA polymerase sigma-70 factor (ECF subfamily)